MARAPLLLFTILCSVLCAETAVDIQQKREQRRKVAIRSLGQCRDGRDYSMMWHNVTSGRNERTGESTISLQVSTKREVSEDLAIVFNFWKCDSSGNPDSCEYVLKDNNVTDICTYMVAKNEAWSSFMGGFDRPLKCPIKTGTYTLKNFPVNSDFLKFMPISDALWKTRLEGYDRGNKVSCVELVIQIVPSYVKKRKG